MARGRFALVLALAAATSLRAQDRSPRVDILVTDRVVAGAEFPATTISGLLTEGHRRDLLNSGWPTAIHARVELWKKGFLGMYNVQSTIEWDLIVEYSPASKVYHIRRVFEGRTEDLGEVSSIEAAEQVLRRPYAATLLPRSRGRYFYLFNIDVSTLSMSDLEAWQRWVKGEAKPAAQGKRNLGTALQRGLGSLLSRALGGETQSYERRSDDFTAG
jgi:hypothetical protein